MARRRSLLGMLLKSLIGLVLTIVLILGGIYAFIYFRYDINLVDVFGYINEVNEDVDTATLINNPYTAEDLESAKAEIDSVSVFDTTITLSDREVAAYINDFILNGDNVQTISVSGTEYTLKDLGFEICQVEFSNLVSSVVDNGNLCDINLVFKLETVKFTENMKDFPMNIVEKNIPDTVYVSSTVTLSKVNEEGKDYKVTSKDISINNLDKKDIDDIFRMVNNFTDIGTIEEFNEKIGGIFVDALIGNEENGGVAYELITKGADGYRFVTVDDKNCFEIYKDLTI